MGGGGAWALKGKFNRYAARQKIFITMAKNRNDKNKCALNICYKKY